MLVVAVYIRFWVTVNGESRYAAGSHASGRDGAVELRCCTSRHDRHFIACVDYRNGLR